MSRSYANVVDGTSHKINEILEKLQPLQDRGIPNMTFKNNNDYRLLFIGANTFLQDAHESDKNDIFEKDYEVLGHLLSVGDQRNNDQKKLTKPEILKEYKKILDVHYNSSSSKLKALKRFTDYGNFFWKEMNMPESDYMKEGFYLTTNNKGTITQGGRLWFALFKQWDHDLSEGWKQSNKGGVGNKRKIEFLLKNNRLINFINEHGDEKIYEGLSEVLNNDKKGFINLLNKLVKTTNYNKRAFYLYQYLQNYGDLPNFYTRKGDNGTILSPLYSVYYELNKPKKRKTSKKRKTTKTLRKRSISSNSGKTTNVSSISNNSTKNNLLSMNNKSIGNSNSSLVSHLNNRSFANVARGVPKPNQ
jgi:hypothetical protein